MSEKPCRVLMNGTRMELISPAFCLVLDSSSSLKAVSLVNKRCNKTLELGGGAELDVDLDSATGRFYIDGWKVKDTASDGVEPNEDEGFVNSYFGCEFNDSAWDGYQTPVMFEDFKFKKDRYKWARTHIFLPKKAEGQKITLTLGGFGLLDFGWMRVFLGGREIGTRVTDKRWHEPGSFELKPSSPDYACLRFGQDNILALQLTDYQCRNSKLNEFDPMETRELSTIGRSWPAQFEQVLVAGQPYHTPQWTVQSKEILSEGEDGRVDFTLVSDSGELTATVRYQWNSTQPVLHKFIQLQNISGQDIRLMNVRLGNYQTNAEPTEGEQGFPVYLEGCFFASVAHPSGWATGQDKRVLLRQYPGKWLQPGMTFECMETLLGVSEKDHDRNEFLFHIESRMRRVKRGHDKAISIFESFGSWPIQSLQLDYGHYPDEKAILHNLDQVEAGQKESGCHFDYYCIEFWNDYCGDFTRPGVQRFPKGFEAIKKKLNQLHTDLGLWIDTSAGRWSIGGNPVIKNCRTYNAAAYERDGQEPILGECYCRAEDPFQSMFTNAFLHHIRENKVRMMKFDDAMAVCHNPNHSHLPGVYSTEAIQNAEIEMLTAFDRVCPELFLILYWGHRSPWWLLHADTVFESGLFLEASTPAAYPTLYARDGVTLTLDQASQWCDELPKLGKDSLGIWLTDWAWNSSIHTQRWQEGLIMDLCRGNLLFQFWSDYDWLSPEDRKQVALFMKLFQKGEACFRHSQRILGSPWKNEPYGYFCSDGNRAFISVYNCGWSDYTACLQLTEWGMKFAESYDCYRWYPDRAKLDIKSGSADQVQIPLRPFETILLEVLPKGESPTLPMEFTSLPVVKGFMHPTVKLELSASQQKESSALRVPMEDNIDQHNNAGTEKPMPPQWSDVPKRILETPNLAEYETYNKKTFKIATRIPQHGREGLLFIAARMHKNQLSLKLNNLGMHFAAEAKLEGESVDCQPGIGQLTYAVPWQGWRIQIPPAKGECQIEFTITAMIPIGTEMNFEGYFIPDEG